jgi:hypothetical protein
MLYQTFKDFPSSVGLADLPLDDLLDDHAEDELAYERQTQVCHTFLRSIPESPIS